MMEQQLIDLCRNQGSRVRILGSDQEQLKYYEVLFNREYFAIVKGNDRRLHYDTMVVLDAGVAHEVLPLGHEWVTIVYVDPAFKDPIIRHASTLMTAEKYIWDGERFNDVSTCSARTDDNCNVAQFIYEGWPELLPYKDDIYVLYAGATSEIAIGPRKMSCLISECREAFANGYTRIMFYNGDETAQPNSISKAQRVADFLRYEVPKDTFFYVSACQQFESIYYDLCRSLGYYNQMIPMSYFRFELQARAYLHGDELMDILNRPYTPQVREKKFLCYNRVPRDHRQLFLAMMYDRGLLDKSYYSFEQDDHSMDMVRSWLDTDNEDSYFNTQDEAQKYYNSLEHIHNNLLPLKLNRTEERDNPVEIIPDDIKYHDNSYFSVVLETIFFSAPGLVTDFSYDGVFFSEKIYKPIATKHPFILGTSPHALSQLRDIGYKTFHPYIDETYDDVEDDMTRLHMIADEVERLSNLSDEDWHDMQLAMAPIVEHNYNWLLNKEKDITVTKNIKNYF